MVAGLVLSAAVFVGFQEYKGTLYANEQERVDHTAEHVGSELASQLDSLERTVSVAAVNPDVAAHGSSAQRRALEAFLERTEFAGVSVIAANGTMTNIVSDVSAERRAELIGSDFGDRTYFQRAVNGTTYVSEPVEAESGNHIITISAPIYRDGRVVGTLNAAFHLSEGEFFERFATTVEGDQRLTLYAQDRTPIYATGPAVEPAFVRNVSVEGTGWTVSVRQSSDSVSSTVQTVTVAQAGSIAAVLAGLFGFGWWIYRRSVTQIGRLLRGFRALEDEQYGAELRLDDTEEWRQVEDGFNRLSRTLERSRAERQRREAELRRERDRFEALFDGIPEPVVAVGLTDGDPVLRDANAAFETTFGYDVDAVVGEDLNDLLLPEDEQAAAEAEEIDARAAAGEQVTAQVRRRAADGVREFLFRSAPVEHDGDTTHQFGVYIDITDRNRYEARLREQRDNLDTLHQVVRHDIRNDLQLVTAYADLLAERLEAIAEECDSPETDSGADAIDEAQTYLRTVRDSADHAVELTKTARDMAKVMLTVERERQPVGLRETLESELESVDSEAPSAVVTVDGSIPTVRVLADEILGSVFRNLLTNAVRHNDKDVPEVTVSATADETRGTVRVRVADNGPGVPDDRKEEIFGKGEKGLESSGTGLGLYLVQTLVDSYGGDVWVEDRPPQRDAADRAAGGDVEGAVFVVELRLADEE
ncbi:ATP-binding protein [Halobellus sp. GM3]|uniref:ATP-binding protein n=1 Tax=Halobellus sp. GM3 TaxID=3458410 RepID=UPI00403D62D5